jgi:hypothetical protein
VSCPTSAPNTNTTNNAADVVASNDLSTTKLRAFAKIVITSTPIKDVTAKAGEYIELPCNSGDF